MKRRILHMLEGLAGLVVLAALVFGMALLRAVGQVRLAVREAAAADAAILTADDAALGAPAPQVQGTPLAPCGATRTQDPTAALPQNLFYTLARRLSPGSTQLTLQRTQGAPAAALRAADDASWRLQLPQGWAAQLSVQDAAGATVYEGPVQETYTRTFTANGTDTARLTLTDAADAARSFTYAFTVTMDAQPVVTLGTLTPTQGDVLAVLVEDNPFDLPLDIQSPLGVCAFVPLEGRGRSAAFLPVSYSRQAGLWPVEVTVGEQVWQFEVDVQPRQFPTQYMTIDASISAATWESDAANAEYRSTIYPLYDVTDPCHRWDGPFIEPVEEYWVSTEYGLYRYTNGVLSERHSGVDMACPLGTRVSAPQNGEVLFAGYLQLTGNTVVLSHGGGLKSLFYHMDSLSVATGDVVATGDKIGEVGTTGYSTGPHLHYEVKIGSYSVDPFPLFEGTSALFTQ